MLLKRLRILCWTALKNTLLFELLISLLLMIVPFKCVASMITTLEENDGMLLSLYSNELSFDSFTEDTH